MRQQHWNVEVGRSSQVLAIFWRDPLSILGQRKFLFIPSRNIIGLLERIHVLCIVYFWPYEDYPRIQVIRFPCDSAHNPEFTVPYCAIQAWL